MADALAGPTQVQGDDAHDAPVSSSPILIGAFASAAAPTAVSADGDAVRLWADRNGAIIVNGRDAHDAALNANSFPLAIGGRAFSTAPTDVSANNDAVAAWFLRNGAQATVITAVGALIDGDATNGLDVDVTRVTGTVTVDSELPAAAALADNTANPTVPGVGAYLMGYDGTTWDRVANGGGTEATALRVTVASDSTGVLSVDDNGSSLTVDAPIGTPVNVQVGNATLAAGVVDETGASAVDALAVGGGTPHDAVDSGNPVKIGSKAASVLPTAVAANDRANAISDLFGRLLVGHIDPGMQTHINKTYTTTQTGTDVWDPAAGKKIAITSIVIGTYGTTAGRIILWFGDNADTTFTQDTDQVAIAASFAPSATSKPGLVFAPSTPVFCTTADRELHVTTDAGISFDVTIEGYEW